jgi:hypothetical protein
MGTKIFSALYKINNTDSIESIEFLEFVHIEQISALYKFHCITTKRPPLVGEVIANNGYFTVRKCSGKILLNYVDLKVIHYSYRRDKHITKTSLTSDPGC